MDEWMFTPEIIPEELGNPDDSENIRVKTMKYLWDSLLGDENNTNENSKSVLDFAMTFEMEKPVVSLYWKKNFKAVTNWMRKHMGTYPETCKGFLVRFIDDKWSAWYRVELCNGDEEGEKINGVNYKILPFRFDVNRNKKNGNNMRK